MKNKILLVLLLIGALLSLSTTSCSDPVDKDKSLSETANLTSEKGKIQISSKTQQYWRNDMQKNNISAEIVPVSGKTNEAALQLQRLGFRVLHIGTSISVEAPEALWKSVFNVSFETTTKNILPGLEGGDKTYRKATDNTLKIPPQLEQFISDVAFVEPPEFY